MKIVIDKQSGFCFGVVRAIEMAENIVNNNEELYCLGEIVHNNEEVERLQNDGMKTIESTDIENIKNKSVLIRAHGEPPETYETLQKNNNTIHDATCPVVLKLQQRVKKGFQEMEKLGGQVIIFGKKGHAEVNGLVGQTKGKATVIESVEDIDEIDFSKPTRLFAQTTKSIEEFKRLVKQIDELTKPEAPSDDDKIISPMYGVVTGEQEIVTKHTKPSPRKRKAPAVNISLEEMLNMPANDELEFTLFDVKVNRDEFQSRENKLVDDSKE